MKLVTLQEAKDHLRVDGKNEDDLIEQIIEGVSGAIESWVGSEERLQDDSEDTLPQVELATLVEVAAHYRYREGAEDREVRDWYAKGYVLSQTATALLAPLRKPRVS